jgi:hypothetical protein
MKSRQIALVLILIVDVELVAWGAIRLRSWPP